MSTINHYIAANRFAYGANSSAISAMGSEPLQWLLNQLQPLSGTKLRQLTSDMWSSQQALVLVNEFRKKKDQLEKMAMMQSDDSQDIARMQQADKKQINQQIDEITSFTIDQAIHSSQPFFWHLSDFFSNHFSVSNTNIIMRALAPTMDIEAIAPNILGRFSDLLLAVTRHPAMLHYLNNVQSAGPSTRFAQKRDSKGLNENLGREILELHTLGVNSQYTQADVTELAKAITGWSVGGFKQHENAGFLFRERMHEPGTRVILGKQYPQKGSQQGEAILRDLANHPGTALHVSTKLVRHFVSDNVDDSQVKAMTERWLVSEGDLTQVITTMLQHPASWQAASKKLKTPREFVISVCRAADIRRLRPDYIKSLTTMGQKPFNAGSPAGYKDTADAWSGPSAMMSRIEWSAYISRTIKQEPAQLAVSALGPMLRQTTSSQIKKAESKEQALTMLMMSPEFQRR